MQPLHINEINDFQEVEINSIPALFTNLRIKRDSIPIGLFAYDIRHNDYQKASTIEPKVIVDHYGTIVTMVKIDIPIHVGDDDYLSITSISYGDNCTLEVWQQQQLEQLAQSGDWRERAIKILQNNSTQTNEIIVDFVDNHWQNLKPDNENHSDFIKWIQSSQ